MIKKQMALRKIIFVFCISFFLTVFYSQSVFSEDAYGYKKQDKAEQQKKYIAKLKDDKKKIELAIINTRTLIERSRNRPYLPELYLRLAELFIEKSRISFFLRKSIRGGQASSLDKMESNTYKTQALEVYQRILDNFPKYKDRDKVHFFMAHEYRELGDNGKMIKHYRYIIRDYKNSTYVPEAYLLLGDYFIAQADVDLAKRHYLSVLDYPESQAVVIARYKLAWCHINKAQYKSAIKLFEQAVESSDPSGELDIDTYKRVDIKQEALIDMAYCYTECYKKSSPEDALSYFQQYAWSRQVYVIVLEKLGYRYLLKKKWQHAAVIYRQLSELQHDTIKLLDYSRNIFECVQAIGKFDNANKDMAYIVKALGKQKYSIHIPDEEKEKNLKDYELYARDLVTHLHQKALKKKSVSNYRRAADAYKLYLDFFEDSPVMAKMEANYAEALFSSKQYLEAGKQYEKLAEASGTDKNMQREKLYSAVISYHTAIKNKKKMNYYQTAYAQDGLRKTGKLYAKNYPKSRHVPDVLFNVAWISYDAGKYDDAIKEFSSFVKKYPSGKPASAAVHLILDAYHLKEDYEGLVKYGKTVLANKSIKDAKLRKEVAGILHTTESKVVSNLTIAAMDNWEKGKEELLNFAQDSKSGAMGEHALNALLVSARDKGDLLTMYSAGEKLINNYPKSSSISDTLGSMINTSVSIAQFRMVADYLESYAKRLPGDKNTKEFLFQAAQIRKDLAQYKQSNKDFNRILKYHSPEPALREQIIFSMAENYEKQSNINEAIGTLVNNRKFLSGSGKVRADALISNFYLKDNNYKKAAKYRKLAYQAYKTKRNSKDGKLHSAVSEMTFNAIHRDYATYMNLQLKGSLDNTIVTKKAGLLEKIEKGYQSVMACKSPEWALAACYYSSIINDEFAKFLVEAPLPNLSADQKENYLKIIDKKAKGYSKKAGEYLQTCTRQAHKWEICKPEFAGFFNRQENNRSYDPFSGNTSNVDISVKGITEQSIGSIHEKLLSSPKNADLLVELSDAYIRNGDFRQSLIITKSALSEIKKSNASVKSDLYNNLGVSHLYAGNDEPAKDAFKKAITCNAKNITARVNLAGLYKYYGHRNKADNIYESLPGYKKIEESGGIIHPRAKEIYYEQTRTKRK